MSWTAVGTWTALMATKRGNPTSTTTPQLPPTTLTNKTIEISPKIMTTPTLSTTQPPTTITKNITHLPMVTPTWVKRSQPLSSMEDHPDSHNAQDDKPRALALLALEALHRIQRTAKATATTTAAPPLSA